MTNWLSASFFSLFSFGLWGFFTKLSVLHIDSKSAMIYQTIGIVIVSIITLGMMNFKPEMNSKGLIYAILTGVAYAIGCWFYFIAASKGKIITVVTLTALYPLVTILLASILLKENITLRQGIGILLSCFAIFLMSV